MSSHVIASPLMSLRVLPQKYEAISINLVFTSYVLRLLRRYTPRNDSQSSTPLNDDSNGAPPNDTALIRLSGEPFL